MPPRWLKRSSRVRRAGRSTCCCRRAIAGCGGSSGSRRARSRAGSPQNGAGWFREVEAMYLWLKLIHVIAVVLFLGNIITGLFWHRHALRTRNASLIAHTMDGVVQSDRLFTMPGVLVILASGIFVAIRGGFPILGTPWIALTIVMFGISGAVFMSRLPPPR